MAEQCDQRGIGAVEGVGRAVRQMAGDKARPGEGRLAQSVERGNGLALAGAQKLVEEEKRPIRKMPVTGRGAHMAEAQKPRRTAFWQLLAWGRHNAHEPSQNREPAAAQPVSGSETTVWRGRVNPWLTRAAATPGPYD